MVFKPILSFMRFMLCNIEASVLFSYFLILRSGVIKLQGKLILSRACDYFALNIFTEFCDILAINESAFLC